MQIISISTNLFTLHWTTVNFHAKARIGVIVSYIVLQKVCAGFEGIAIGPHVRQMKIST